MKLVDFLRPLLRRMPRQSIHLLGLLGAGWGDDPAWKSVKPQYRAYFDEDLGCIVTVDVSEWGGRSCYYWARFWDVSHQLLLRKVLKLGDTYIDVGTNLGFQSMFASRLVGPSGTVLSFEPNPETFLLLSAHIAMNRIRNCKLHNVALGEAESEAVLNLMETHSGTATLRAVAGKTRSVTVPVRRGDDVLRDTPFTGKTVLKMDVEGFELLALRGLPETLSRVSIAVVEVTPEWLAAQGGTAEQLMILMKELGFTALIPTVEWTMGLFSPKLHFAPATPLQEQTDVCFVRDVAAFHQLG